jgi:hypothetical protein
MKTVFYAWQSDLPNRTNRSFIDRCLEVAIERVNATRPPAERLVLDKDTQGVSGMPVVSDVIFKKIAGCAVLVADLSFITPKEAPRAIPNPNVLVELGYALGTIGDRRIVALFNSAFGDPYHLPFDLRNRRFPLSYHASEGAPSDTLALEREKLVARLAEALIESAKQAPQEPDTGESDPLPPHAAGPLPAYAFAIDRAIARVTSRDDENRESEYVYWHHHPSAWLRVIPIHQKGFKRPQLEQLVRGSPIPLQAFGGSASSQLALNDFGLIALGFDGKEPDTIATRLTQVFLTGEMWGVNRILIEPRRTEPRTFEIPWPGVAQAFETTLRHYLQFARETLGLELPVTVIAGLENVKDAKFMREGKWAGQTPQPARSFESSIIRTWTMSDFDADVSQAFRPLYEAILEACGLDYAREPSVYK